MGYKAVKRRYMRQKQLGSKLSRSQSMQDSIKKRH